MDKLETIYKNLLSKEGLDLDEEEKELRRQFGEDRAAWHLWRMYRQSRRDGNAQLNISESLSEVRGLSDQMKAFGVKSFTFSSSWSSAIETLDAFIKEGWAFDGMTTVWEGARRRPAVCFRPSLFSPAHT